MAQHVTKRSPTAFKHFRVTDLRGTVSTAKQSSAELMAASPYPCLPSIQIQAGRPPPPPVQSPPLFCLRNSLPWHKRSHSGGDCSYGGRKKRVFLVGEGRGGGGLSCVGRLSEVNNKAHFCVGELELSHEQCSELFTDQPVLINGASGALT